MNNNKLPKNFEEFNGSTWLVENDRDNMRLYYKVKEVLCTVQSPYQLINIIDSVDFGRCLVLDGAIQTTELDGYIYNEMISHIPIVTHPNPKKILIIGGGDCGAANEIIKYPKVEKVDLVEIDQLVVENCIKHLPQIPGNTPYDNRVHFIFKDGVQFVKEKKDFYDVAIIDSSDPIGPAEALFSEDFYLNVKNCLKEDGLMVCQSQSPIFHSKILQRSHGLLKKYFPLVKTYQAVVPSYPGGMWSFTLASLKYDPFKADLERLVQNTRYINKDIFHSAFSLPNFMRAELQEIS